MAYGKMRNRSKKIKNVRIYHANYKSFLELKRSHFFVYMESGQKKYQDIIIEFLVHVVNDINYKDRYSFEQFETLLSDYFELVEVSNDMDFPNYMINGITSQLYDIYKESRFPDFRGEVLELIMLYLEKSNNNKVFHEPHFYYKRNRLFDKEFPGSNCLIDVVFQEKRNHNITLIECKTNLDNRIKRLHRSGDKFHRKLRFMDRLEDELSEYVNYQGEKIEVDKVLASVKVPSLKLPESYVNYEYVNLYDHFMLKRKIC